MLNVNLKLIMIIYWCFVWILGYSSGYYIVYINNNGVWYRYDDNYVIKVIMFKFMYVI